MFLLVLLMTFIGSLGALMFKRASVNCTSILALLQTHTLYIGGICYGISAMMNIILLRYMDFSVVYPMTAITYLWTMLISHRILGEPITRKKIIGIALICFGVFLLNTA